MLDFDSLEQKMQSVKNDFQKANKKSRVYKQAEMFPLGLDLNREFTEDEVDKINSKMKGSVRLAGGNLEQIAQCCKELLEVVNEETKNDKIIEQN